MVQNIWAEDFKLWPWSNSDTASASGWRLWF